MPAPPPHPEKHKTVADRKCLRESPNKDLILALFVFANGDSCPKCGGSAVSEFSPGKPLKQTGV